MNRVRGFCWLAGLADSLTGASLVIAPRLTLRLMGIAAESDEAILLRFIGVFVGCVGLSYLVALTGSEKRRSARLLGVLELTTLFRAAVALFVTWGVLVSHLEPAWLSVAGTDALIALIQVRILTSEALRARI